ncbi:hypothetical protein [Amycolatopsis regifaucium]|uniref:hypothetical protein n=1 Tax=Amycolatopsis regifaucium TaxID=546365 RepID=UPI0008F643A4|nr:hypothetical protein [Amycolatopsis regifaucium]SFI63041.1 hypothetical protein SAMN04489731_1124 [Amycolatopsis regifaucium]
MVVDGPRGPAETVVYPGITLTRPRHGHVVDELWLPVGEAAPTVADDEALIAAMRDAWRWSASAA